VNIALARRRPKRRGFTPICSASRRKPRGLTGRRE
jgi:hypothetical protein